MRTLYLIQRLIETDRGSLSNEVLLPPADARPFAEFEPLVLSGPAASELLVADRR